MKDMFPEVKKKRKDKGRTDFINSDERELIKIYVDQNKSLYFMGQVLNRHPSTISDEIKRNGGREKYDPVAAETRYKKLKRKAIGKRTSLALDVIGIENMKTRIANLEMQLEILIDQIKQLKEQND
jgi:IS30 family transposase